MSYQQEIAEELFLALSLYTMSLVQNLLYIIYSALLMTVPLMCQKHHINVLIGRQVCIQSAHQSRIYRI